MKVTANAQLLRVKDGLSHHPRKGPNVSSLSLSGEKLTMDVLPGLTRKKSCGAQLRLMKMGTTNLASGATAMMNAQAIVSIKCTSICNFSCCDFLLTLK